MDVAQPDQPVTVVMMRNAMNARMQQRVDGAQSERTRSDSRQRNRARQQLFVSQRRGEHRRIRDRHMDVEVVRNVELVSARERPLPYAELVAAADGRLVAERREHFRGHIHLRAVDQQIAIHARAQLARGVNRIRERGAFQNQRLHAAGGEPIHDRAELPQAKRLRDRG